MHQLVYISSASRKFTAPQLVELLELSRERNLACGVTGLLLFINGNFIQLLEGEKEAVHATFARIQADERHRGVNTLWDAPCEHRDFPDWTMGFETLEGPSATGIPGYSDFLSKETKQSEKDSAALQLLSFFKRVAR